MFCRVWSCITSSLKCLPFLLTPTVHFSPEWWWRLKLSLLLFCCTHLRVCCFEQLNSDWVAVAFVILGSRPSRNHITTLSSGRAGTATKSRIHSNNIQQTKPKNSCQRPPWYPILVPIPSFKHFEQSGHYSVAYPPCCKVCIVRLSWFGGASIFICKSFLESHQHFPLGLAFVPLFYSPVVFLFF